MMYGYTVRYTMPSGLSFFAGVHETIDDAKNSIQSSSLCTGTAEIFACVVDDAKPIHRYQIVTVESERKTELKELPNV